MTREEINTVKQARMFVSVYMNTIWVRKDTRAAFDVTMGPENGVWITSLIGLYILSKLKVSMLVIDSGLYRDDALFYY